MTLMNAQWAAMMARSWEPRQWYLRDGQDEAEFELTLDGEAEGLKVWVYRQDGSVWRVGFYDPSGRWHNDSDHFSRGDAVERVHYLNGGDGGG